jgi:hypothetical protein
MAARAGGLHVRIDYIRVFVAIGMALAGPCMAQKPDALTRWENFDFAHHRMTADDLKDLSLLQLKYMRGIVFGKHGRVFDEPAIQAWLKTRPWYHPDPKYRVTVLNDNERADMDAIKEAEFHKHTYVEPGDLKFYRTKALTPSELGSHSAIEWMIMRAEIEAIHGKPFPNQPWLQSFFAERYWYHPDPKYKPSVLTEIDRKNLATIATAQKEQRKVALAPGDMALFQETPITAGLLRGLSLQELRVLRNEVYARRGKRFRTEWLQDLFEEEEWYHPRKDFDEPTLSRIEKQNVETIVAAETRLHESLNTKPLAANTLQNMGLEDAVKLREEIYARHGKIFKDRWTDGYFRSFKWYKPDPNFAPSSLSALEKRNVATIAVYEKRFRQEGAATAA